MFNLTAPRQHKVDETTTTFDVGCQAIDLYTSYGEKVRITVSQGFLYINGQPFGVQGMPAANHAETHSKDGADAVTPAAIGAVSADLLATDPKANGIPVLDADGKIKSSFLAGNVDPTAHRTTHATGGTDAISPADIGAVAVSDPRLADARTPKAHKASHGVEGTDRIMPSDIGACDDDDYRLSDRRQPLDHNSTHFKNGSDPISWADVGSVDATQFTEFERIPNGYPQLNSLGYLEKNLLPDGLPTGNHGETHGFDGKDPVVLDATQVTTGVFDLARIPKAAQEKLYRAANRTARMALTTADVQNGDSVQELDTQLLYLVVDDTKLGTDDAFVTYTAGYAAQVPWSGVEDKPSVFPPSSHAASHRQGGSDELTAASIGAATAEDIATVAAQKANNNHASTAITYGLGTTTKYGHVKLSDTNASTNTDGMALSQRGGFLIAQNANTYAKAQADAVQANLDTLEGEIPTMITTATSPLAERITALEQMLASGVIGSTNIQDMTAVQETIGGATVWRLTFNVRT